MKFYLRTSTLAVRVQLLLLGWNTCLLCNFDIVNFVWKTDEGRQNVFFYQFLFFGGALIVGGWGLLEWDRKSYLGSTEIASFSSPDFSRNKKNDTFWRFVSTGYFYVLFSWAIAVSDFCPLEIFMNLQFWT